MIDIACLCGQVRLRVAERPDFIHACNCTLCRKTGAQWSYHHPSTVTVEGETLGYRRSDKASANAEIRFCGTCGSTTHFVLTEAAVAAFGNSMMGVNLRLADEAALAGVERRYPDGAAWSGEGPFDYVRAPETIGAAPAAR